MIIRREMPADISDIHRVNAEAFPQPEEAKLVDALREHGKVTLSLVAVAEEKIVGHILFFPLAIENASRKFAALGLGPMAVTPNFQRQGIGSALVHAGLDELRGREHPGVIVLGHPEFYPRFGFVPASTYGITTHYEVPYEVFMALELEPGSLADKGGIVVYPDEFDTL